MKNTENNRGPLDTLEIIRPNSEFATIILHGFGADASDLFPLHQALSTSEKMSWIFPNAPLEAVPGTGFQGRAWFHIDIEALNRRMMNREQPREDGLENPKGLKEARTAIDQMIEEISTELKIPKSKIVIGGFSQGAMMAVDTALRSSENLAGLIIFSGSYLNESEWTNWAPNHSGLPFFQSHGSADPLLSINLAKRLSIMLQGAGLKGQLQSFSGGHEIPMEMLKLAASFISKKVICADTSTKISL